MKFKQAGFLVFQIGLYSFNPLVYGAIYEMIARGAYGAVTIPGVVSIPLYTGQYMKSQPKPNETMTQFSMFQSPCIRGNI